MGQLWNSSEQKNITHRTSYSERHASLVIHLFWKDDEKDVSFFLTTKPMMGEWSSHILDLYFKSVFQLFTSRRAVKGLIAIGSGVARAFPGGQVAHPEGQNEEENK